MKKDYQLADWIIHPELNSVSRGAELTHLEPKVMQVLVELSVRAGEVVHKEDLIQLVWPNTFVGDDVLIRCISELRRIFGDNPRSPRVIQTISKVGYRLIAPVTTLASATGQAVVVESLSESQDSAAISVDAPPETPKEVQQASKPAPSVPIGPRIAEAELNRAASATGSGGVGASSGRLTVLGTEESRSKQPPTPLMMRRWLALAAAALVVLTGIVIFRTLRAGMLPLAGFKVVPFTSYPGSERQPAFSPDGNQIVFTWNGEDDGESWNLYTKLIGSETPLRLTTAAADDLSPVWSPDGKWIAFVRRSQQGNGIYLVPAIGGPERKLYDLHCAIDWDAPGLSWSPDGKQLIFPDGKSETSPSSIVSLSLETLRTKPLTFPQKTWDGDYGPAFSPDGHMIAFVRGTDVGSRSVYVMDAAGKDPKQVTSEEQQIHGLAWAGNGKSIVFSSNAGGTVALWRVPSSGGTAQRLALGTDKAYTPAISRAGDRLVYSQGADTWSILRIDLKSPHPAAIRMISSTEQDSGPQLSHDASRIAFHSRRSGNQEIWVSSTSNIAPMKLTSFNGPLTGSPSWSPDDTQIAFDSRTQGWSHIFVIEADGGAPRPLTQGDFNDIVPNWSSDGKCIYFSSKRTGTWQIWKVSVSSGQVEQVTRNGGFVAKDSTDGHWLYYTKYDRPGLWRMPLPGGEEVKLLDDPPPGYWAYFSVTPAGIYYLDQDDKESAIDFYNFASSSSTRLYKITQPPVRFSSLTVSGDGRWVLFTNAVSRFHDLVLTENFR